MHLTRRAVPLTGHERLTPLPSASVRNHSSRDCPQMTTINDYDRILRKIREHLHDHRGSRAAVMVGAGFSKNAESLTSIRAHMPSWTELVSELTTRLNPEDKQTSGPEPTTETSSALRLAQEFEAAEGRPALIQLVRETIAEESFAPGKLHVKLLELPWADVFTTNYDCLLEKASRKVRRQTFDVIRGVADIPSARRPPNCQAAWHVARIGKYDSD
jgi:hypothetical protein